MFILHDIQGYQHRQIGEILGCTTENSKSQLHKARLRLRELLREPSRERHIKPLATLGPRHALPSQIPSVKCAVELNELKFSDR